MSEFVSCIVATSGFEPAKTARMPETVPPYLSKRVLAEARPHPPALILSSPRE